MKKITQDIREKRRNKEEKKRILEVNRKVKQQLVHFQQKMSKRAALMKKLVKLKHKVEKTTPYYVGSKSVVDNENAEDAIISEFILKNKEIKKMTHRLKSMRTMRKPSLHLHLTKKKYLKGDLTREVPPTHEVLALHLDADALDAVEESAALEDAQQIL